MWLVFTDETTAGGLTVVCKELVEVNHALCVLFQDTDEKDTENYYYEKINYVDNTNCYVDFVLIFGMNYILIVHFSYDIRIRQ